MVHIIGKKTLYECPSCKTHNEAEEKYCTKCGHWLQSVTYPPRTIHKKSLLSHLVKFSLVILCLIPIILVINNLIKDNKIDLTGKLNELSETIETTKIIDKQDYLYESKISIGKRDNPSPVGKKVTFNLEQQKEFGSEYYLYRISVQVNSILRGKDALSIMGELGGNTDKLNLALSEGYEYLMANISISVLSSEDNASLAVYPEYFSLRNSEGITYDTSISLYKYLFNTKIAEGKTESGWFSFIVSESDKDPLLELIDTWFSTN